MSRSALQFRRGTVWQLEREMTLVVDSWEPSAAAPSLFVLRGITDATL